MSRDSDGARYTKAGAAPSRPIGRRVPRASGMDARSPRPCTSYFNAESLALKLMPLAALKKPGFAWDGTTYSALGQHRAVEYSKYVLVQHRTV